MLRYPWKRFWIPRGESAHLDQGFLLDPDAEIVGYANRHVRPLACYEDIPCLVLLGAAGAGKTTELAQLEGPGEESIVCDLGGYSSEDRLWSDLFGSEVVRARSRRGEGVRFVLDGLDEAMVAIPRVAQTLQRGLKPLLSVAPQVRIACRACAWPENLTQFFSDYFGEEGVRILELAPLREEDVRIAAGFEGIDVPGFLSEVEQKQVGPLAAVPVTLALLMKHYRAHARLPDKLIDIYEQGLLSLCSPSEGRLDKQIVPELNPSQLLDVSTVLAGLTVICGKPVLYTGPAGAEPPNGLGLSEISARIESPAGHEIVVGDRAVTLALRETALFSSCGEYLHTFGHRTYAEFLAARFLCQRRMPLPQMRSLLLTSAGRAPTTIPQLRGVASWLAALDRGFFDELMKVEPETLLHPDTRMVDEESRERLVESLLTRIEEGRVPRQRWWDLEANLAHLDHPGLACQLRPIIADRGGSALQREVAIMIAEACRLTDLAAEMALVALDETSVLALRKAAAYAVVGLGNEETCRMLRPLALGQSGDDPDDDLRGLGLEATWRYHLTVQDFFGCLTPPRRRNYFGSYARFLHGVDVVSDLGIDDLPLALAWVKQLPIDPGHDSDKRWAVGHAVLTKAWHAIGVIGVPGGFAEIAYARSRSFVPVFGEDEGEKYAPGRGESCAQWNSEIRRSTDSRRALVKAVVEMSRDPDRLQCMACLPTPLVLREDFSWLVEQTRTSSCEGAKRWAALATHAFDPDNAEHVELWLEAKRDSPAIAAAMPWLEVVDLHSEEARAARETDLENKRLTEEVQREAAQRGSQEERVKRALDHCLAGSCNHFWVLAMEVIAGQESSRWQADVDIQQTDWWGSSGEPCRIEVLQAAKDYMARGDPSDGDPTTRKEMFYADFAPAKAFSLVLERDRNFVVQLPAERWRTWLPYLLVAHVRLDSEGVRRMSSLVGMAHERVPMETERTVLRLIESGRDEKGEPHVLRMIARCPSDRFARALLEQISEGRYSRDGFSGCLKWLLKRAPGLSRERAERWARGESLRPEDGVDYSVEAAVALIEATPDAGWAVIWPRLRDDPSWGRAVLERVVDRGEIREVEVGSKLNELQMGELLAWLLQEYPPDSDPHPPGYFR